jgi:hypothetical protein
MFYDKRICALIRSRSICMWDVTLPAQAHQTRYQGARAHIDNISEAVHGDGENRLRKVHRRVFSTTGVRGVRGGKNKMPSTPSPPP